MKKGRKGFDISDVLGGTINVLGLKIDLADLLSSQEKVKEQLEQLREKLKEAGGEEVLTDEEWKRGGMTVSGYVRTRGILGEREYHLGTVEPRARRRGEERVSRPPETVEPPADIFYEANEVIVVAEVPGVGLEDLELKVQDDVFSLSTRPGARRSYRREIKLAQHVEPGTLEATCRNGVLEVHLQKKAP